MGTSAENYDEFLSELGVNFLLRKAATASSPVFEVSVEGDVISFKTSTMLKSMELKFKLGEEFDEKVPTVVTLRPLSLKRETSLSQSKPPKRRAKSQPKLFVNSRATK